MRDEDDGERPARDEFRVFRPMGTRWMDNDAYGHVNNVVYYSYFDTAVNGWLMEAADTDIRRLPAIGVVVETSCRFLKPLSFPDQIEVGLAVEHVGRSSVVYRIGIFIEGEREPAALGRFVHVYVDERTRRPVAIPEVIRAVVEPLLAD